ncbi:FAD-binding protein [Nocardia sp. CA2R105]|uniref:FAD-dependent oxidoreductase n=1 Tax=Nocardia coffeae TaxID=2873381 RepID=UPI001CA71A38|nr:FAD-dependent oxidoreductase [Nocardia coffeae]MBY8860916.1 FAD-binding protein [Nocardia coffeae]
MSAVEETYDVIVVGSGGGLVGAYTAASRGLRTLVIEKTDRFGGTVAYSGAGLWFPGSAPLRRAGVSDDVEPARTYLRDIVADPSREARQDAYLATAPQLIDELEQNPSFGPFEYGPVPDYFKGRPGATAEGRTIFPVEIPAAELGELAALVRDNIPVERHGRERNPVLVGGRALIARALRAFLNTGNGSYLLETAVQGLIVEDGRVVGVEAVRNGEQLSIRASRGVILAAGGFERNRELREKYGVAPYNGDWSNGSPGNTGDVLQAAVAIGAATDLLDEAWFIPGLVQPNGQPIFHTGVRGGFWVNGAGERFMNEAMPYDQAGHEMLRLHKATGIPHIPAHWVFDQRQLDRDSFGGDPSLPPRPEWFESGALRKASTLAELAEIIDVPIENLRKTVAEYNDAAAKGVDEKFHRGEGAWDGIHVHVVGFPAGQPMNYVTGPNTDAPNPLLPLLDTAPYYAATIVLSDIGTKGGLQTDENARVLRENGEHIPGLYASGNTMAAMSGRVYPGAGTPIGSSLVFSYRAVLDITGAEQ